MASNGLVATILLVSSIPMWERTVQANHRRTTDEPTPKTVDQVATKIGVTEGAVRSQIKSGTLPAAKDVGTVSYSCRAGIGGEIRQAVGGSLLSQPSWYMIVISSTKC
jgi:hypothetical protein